MIRRGIQVLIAFLFGQMRAHKAERSLAKLTVESKNHLATIEGLEKDKKDLEHRLEQLRRQKQAVLP